jgi:hypothetical protein
LFEHDPVDKQVELKTRRTAVKIIVHRADSPGAEAIAAETPLPSKPETVRTFLKV